MKMRKPIKCKGCYHYNHKDCTTCEYCTRINEDHYTEEYSYCCNVDE